MRPITYLCLLLLFTNCQNTIKDEPVSNKETPESTITEVQEPAHYSITKNKTVYEMEDLFGYWVGWFMPDEEDNEEKWEKDIYAGEGFQWRRENKITISIDTIRNDSIIGHSVVAGNYRSFKGTFQLKDDVFVFNASEPGDHKYDGIFQFSVKRNDDSLNGTWKANKKIAVPKRIYSLQKKTFEYYAKNKLNGLFVDWMKTKLKKVDFEGEWEDMESYFTTTEMVNKLNPSVDLLSEDQVAKLTKADIYVLRNSIYAKHGYSFKKRALRVYFDSHDWYMPVHVNIKDELTELEKKNIKLLLRYEKYAEEYYDEFGRG